MSDDLKAAGDGLWARINHPVIGVFLTSSLLWNWEVIYYIFRGLETPQATICFVHLNYLNWNNWFNLLLIPTVITFIFLAAAPWLKETYDRYKEWTNKLSLKLVPRAQYEFENLSAEHQRALTNEQTLNRDQQSQLRRQIEELSAQSKNLEKELVIYKKSRTLVDGGSVFVPGAGTLNALNLLRTNDSLRIDLNNSQNEVQRLNQVVNDLNLKITELHVSLKQCEDKK